VQSPYPAKHWSTAHAPLSHLALATFGKVHGEQLVGAHPYFGSLSFTHDDEQYFSSAAHGTLAVPPFAVPPFAVPPFAVPPFAVPPFAVPPFAAPPFVVLAPPDSASVSEPPAPPLTPVLPLDPSPVPRPALAPSILPLLPAVLPEPEELVSDPPNPARLALAPPPPPSACPNSRCPPQLLSGNSAGASSKTPKNLNLSK